nr:TetR/AcrR family transcriptional regulator [Brevibacterium renqingii]
MLSGTKSYQFAIAVECCQDHSVTSRGRPYAGASREARESARRERIIAAGIELFGTEGYRAATVGAVCEAAGLNKRYFYESFASLEDLLCEVYERVVADLRAAVLAGGGDTAPEVLRGFIAAFLGWAQANPVRAKVHLFEVLGVSARVDELYRSHGRSIGDELVDRLVRASSGPALTPARQRILGDVLVGAGLQLVVDWVISGYDPPRDDLLAEADETMNWAMAAGMAALGFG